jgi:hypothetical protein
LNAGKAFGATRPSLTTLFANGQESVDHPSSIPGLLRWKEISLEQPLTGSRLKNACDYIVLWLRDPVERGVDAYHDYMTLLNETYQAIQGSDPTGTASAAKSKQHKFKIQREQDSKLLKQRLHAFEQYGDLNGLAEQLYDNGNNVFSGSTNHPAQHVFGSIDHIRYSMAWYFWSDSTLGLQPLPTKSGPFVPPRTASSWLTFPDFLSKLVFVGSNECYDQDLERFQSLFSVSEAHRWMSTDHNTTLKISGKNKHVMHRLSPTAIQNLRTFFNEDYKVLHTLKLYGLLQCRALLDKINPKKVKTVELL